MYYVKRQDRWKVWNAAPRVNVMWPLIEIWCVLFLAQIILTTFLLTPLNRILSVHISEMEYKSLNKSINQSDSGGNNWVFPELNSIDSTESIEFVENYP